MASPIGPKRFSCFSLFCAKIIRIMDEDKEIISEPVSNRPRLLFRILGNLYQEDLKLSKPKLPNLFRPGTVYNPDGSIIKKNLPLSSSSNEALIPVPFLSMTAEIKRTCPLIRDHLLQGDLWEAAGIPRIEATCQIGDLSSIAKAKYTVWFLLRSKTLVCAVPLSVQVYIYIKLFSFFWCTFHSWQ
jgi:hypothetical protein